MSNSAEVSVLSRWLEQRLKEYFSRKTKRAEEAQEEKYHWANSLSTRNNAVPISAAVLDFRILDLKLEKESRQVYNHYLDDDVSDENAKSSCSSPDDEPYRQGNSRVFLIYQKGCHSVGKELYVRMLAAQLDDVNEDANEGVFIPSKYVLSLDEHQIDVYTRVFPLLQDWALSRKVIVNFCVPECYYGCYQTEIQKPEAHEIPDNYIFKDDIMSKAAVGMEFYEKEKRNVENNPTKQSSYRLLILEDVEKVGFKRRIGLNSTFLSLLNVEEALKCLAELHCVSWTFSVITRTPLTKAFPFLDNPLYIPYVGESVIRGFPVMVGLVRDYLLRSEAPEYEVKRILQSLIKLKTRLVYVLEESRHPKTVKCLVHQDACGARFLFRYSLLGGPNKKTADKQKGDYDYVNATSSQASNSAHSQEEQESEVKARRDLLQKGLKREVMVINWQTASIGSPMLDVAFLLMTSLPPKTRRAETSSLLKIYWNTFRMHATKFGVGLEWSDKELYNDYLESLLYTCVLVTGNVDEETMREVDDDSLEAFVECIRDLINAEAI